MRLNKKRQNEVKQTKQVKQKLNHEGAPVLQLSPLETLFSKVLGAYFGESTFYEKRGAEQAQNELAALFGEVDETDKEYILKIALLGRKLGMKSYPIHVLAEAYHSDLFSGASFVDGKGINKLRYYTNGIVWRAKDVNDIVAHHKMFYESRPLPNQLRKNLKRRLEEFDTYKLSKGLDKKGFVSLRDSIKLLHPRPKNGEMENAFSSILQNNLIMGGSEEKAEMTVVLSTINNVTADKAPLTEEEKADRVKKSLLGATLRTLLRNIKQVAKFGLHKDAEALEALRVKLIDVEAATKEKILPQEVYLAHRALTDLGGREIQNLRDALEELMERSLDNAETLDGFNAIMVDVSYSMETPLAKYSDFKYVEMAGLLGAIAFKKGHGDLFVYASNGKKLDVSPKDSVFSIVNRIQGNNEVGAGTQFDRALNALERIVEESGSNYDNLIVFTDNDSAAVRHGRLVHQNIFSVRNKDLGSIIEEMHDGGAFKYLWINNMCGNDFLMTPVEQSYVRFATGFSMNFIKVINIQLKREQKLDIRELIDEMLREL